MFHRTLVQVFPSPVDAVTTWSYVSDPVATAAASSHAKVVPPMAPLRVGSVWDEYHLEDDCDFDSLRWRCTGLVPGRSLTVEGLQSGARQRATTTVAEHDGLVQVESRLRIGPSLRAPGSVVERLLLPVLLLTPFGVRLLREDFDESVQDDRRALESLA